MEDAPAPLLAAHKRLKVGGGTLVLNNRQPQIRKVFGILEALPDIQVFRSDAQLDACLTAMRKRGGQKEPDDPKRESD